MYFFICIPGNILHVYNFSVLYSLLWLGTPSAVLLFMYLIGPVAVSICLVGRSFGLITSSDIL